MIQNTSDVSNEDYHAFSYSKRKLSRPLGNEKMQYTRDSILNHRVKFIGDNQKTDVLELTLRGYKLSKKYQEQADPITRIVVDDIDNELDTCRKSSTKKKCIKAA